MNVLTGVFRLIAVGHDSPANGSWQQYLTLAGTWCRCLLLPHCRPPSQTPRGSAERAHGTSVAWTGRSQGSPRGQPGNGFRRSRSWSVRPRDADNRAFFIERAFEGRVPVKVSPCCGYDDQWIHQQNRDFASDFADTPADDDHTA